MTNSGRLGRNRESPRRNSISSLEPGKRARFAGTRTTSRPVTGQVYNSNAITYRPRRTAGWYLRRAGGATDQGNIKMVFLIHANGAVESRQAGALWNGGVLATVVEPGDTLVVPEKAIGGSNGWKNLIAIAQLAEAAATTAFIATR